MLVRLATLFALGLFGCSSSGNGNTGGDGGNPLAPQPLTCAPSTFIVHQAFPLPAGKTIRTASITSAKVDFSTTPATLTATLADGGKLELRWKGDARAGKVAVYGSMTTGGAATSVQCIDEQSQIHFTSATDVTFERFVVGLGDGLGADDEDGSCHQPWLDKTHAPPPLPATIDYEACIALPP